MFGGILTVRWPGNPNFVHGNGAVMARTPAQPFCSKMRMPNGPAPITPMHSGIWLLKTTASAPLWIKRRSYVTDFDIRLGGCLAASQRNGHANHKRAIESAGPLPQIAQLPCRAQARQR